MLLNSGVGEDSWEYLGLQGDPTSQLQRKSVPNIHWKDWCWSWYPNILATWCEELTHWKRPWCWERLKAGGEGDDRGWDGWMASPTQTTWVWARSGSWWWTGKPGVLQSMGSQRVGHDWTELNWTEATQMVSAGPKCLFLEGGWSTVPGVYCSSVATWADGCAVSLMEISVSVINRFLEQWWGRWSFTVQSHNSFLARMWHAAKLFYLYCLLGAPSVMEEAGKWRVGWKGRLH